MKGILSVGLSTYDITVPMDGPLIENRKYTLAVKNKGGGGPAYNAAYLCAKWGVQTWLRSRLAHDQYGDELRRVIEEIGVNTDELIYPENYFSSYSYIFTNDQNGDRTIMNFREKPSQEHYVFPDRDIGVILSDGHEPVLSLDAFEQYPDAVRVADAGTAREDTIRVAREVDYLVASQVFAEGILGEPIDLADPVHYTEQFAAIEAVNGKTAVITLGDQGLLYREETPEDAEKTGEKSGTGRVIHMPAFPVKAVDTTGAGDIFHGAFVYGIACGMPLPEVLRLSSMAAAVSVESIGSQSSIPELKTVQERLLSI